MSLNASNGIIGAFTVAYYYYSRQNSPPFSQEIILLGKWGNYKKLGVRSETARVVLGSQSVAEVPSVIGTGVVSPM